MERCGRWWVEEGEERERFGRWSGESRGETEVEEIGRAYLKRITRSIGEEICLANE